MKKYILIFTLFLVTAFGCNNSTAEQNLETDNPEKPIAAPAATAVALPAFKIVDLNGKPFNLADFKGKKILVNLWASWCPPCRAEIPSLENLYAKVDKSKVAFVMLSLDNEFELAVNFASKNKMTTPVYYPAENLPAIFKVEGIPATFIFDEKGNLINRIDGAANYDTEEYFKLFSN